MDISIEKVGCPDILQGLNTTAYKLHKIEILKVKFDETMELMIMKDK